MSLRKLFEQYKLGGLAHLKGLKDQAVSESRLLDFKLVGSSRGLRTDDDKRNYSRALSGFANSDGGIIVWGVECNSDGGKGPDIVRGYKPIGELKFFESDLKSLEAALVSPAVAGVEHHLVEEHPNSGYALTYIPRVDGFPCMATADKLHRFYYRASNSFKYMEQWMVASRFAIQPQPKLRLDWFVNNLSEDSFSIIIVVKNESIVVARNISFLVDTSDLPPRDYCDLLPMDFSLMDFETYCRGVNSGDIHMHQYVRAFEIRFDARPIHDINLRYQLSSNNSFHKDTLKVTIDEILADKEELDLLSLNQMF